MQAAPSQLHRFFADAAHRSAVGRAIPDGSVIKFELDGPGGGVWSLRRRGARVQLVDHPANPDCLLKCTAADFQALVTGALDPTEGFMSGRLEVAGDIGIVLGLHEALRSDG